MVGGGGTLVWPNLIKSYQVGLAIVYPIDDSRPLISSTSTSEDHEARHEHFIDDMNDAVISTRVGPRDVCTVDLNAFQQGRCNRVFNDVAVGI